MLNIHIALSIIFCGLGASAQVNCSNQFKNNTFHTKKKELETKALLLNSGYEYEYEITFKVTDEGVYMVLTSTDIHPLEKENTRIQFISEDGEKMVLNFTNQVQKITVRNRPAFVNTLLMNISLLEWFSTKRMKSFRVVNMMESKMYDRAITRITELKELATCVLSEIDPSKIKHVSVDATVKTNIIQKSEHNNKVTKNESVKIIMKRENGIFLIPCKVNGLPLEFIFDTGASNVSISQTEVIFMLKNNYLKIEDLGETTYAQIADGSIIEGQKILLKEIDISGIKLKNIEASYSKTQIAPLLLGQSAIKKLGPIQIDDNELIILYPENINKN
jgi:clan AA aspartic protease (TIGR02281 family)